MTIALKTIALQNSEMLMVVRPDLGGRIDRLQDRRTGHDWLWHPETYDPSQTRSLPIGASFDEHWTGGWDEVFPSDVEGEFHGYAFVDHGELWSQNWQVVEASSFHVTMSYACRRIPVIVTKRISLHETQAEAKIEYWFQNMSEDTIPFLFKQHAAIAIDEGDQILLPDCWIEPAVPDFSRIIGQPQKTQFPKAFDAEGREIEVQYTPPRSSKLQEFYYSMDLAVGECGIYNERSQSSLRMSFDTADFPYVWVFQSYGGWHDRYVLVLEPCTTIPYDLETACAHGTAALLKPLETQHRTLTVKLQSP